MKILVIAHYQGDGSPTASFIHAQIVEYVRLGHTVKVIVPVAMCKKDYFGKRLSRIAIEKKIDGAMHYFVRYLSISHYGEYSVNICCLKQSIHMAWNEIFIDFVPDVVHAHTIGLDSEAAYYVKRKLWIPAVLTVHGSDVEKLLKEHTNRIKLYCDHMDRIVAVSSVLKRKLEPYFFDGKITCILNGFVAKEFDNRIKKPFRIIQVGNLIPLKRVNITIDAFAYIHKIFSDSVLVIIGEGPERASLLKKCKDMGLRDCVVFRGQLGNQEVLEEMAESSYFVMASSPEGFGIVYLEAMSMGCLTIGSKGEGISDLIVNEKNGYLVSIDNADEIAKIIVDMIRNPEKREIIARRGMQDVQTLTWESNARKYLDLFKSLI